LLWIHAPSVGEGLQARPVLQLMRARQPSTQLAYTHFSPSALQFAASLDVDFHDFLPFDTPTDAAVALESLDPTAIIFSKLDVWPALTRAAQARGVRLGLISATLARSSSRRSRTASVLLRDAYAALDAVGAVDDADADRLVELGVRPSVVTVTGDTRYDQVWERAERADRTSPLLGNLRSSRPTLVAGSTWPSDDAVLLPAFIAARRVVPDARLIIAPHEPTADHLTPLQAWANRESLAVTRLDDARASHADVIIVDRVGVLGDLYAVADVAFVGGAFHSAGLHSVLEPAAFGAPVLFGPRHHGSRDAGLLIGRGGAFSVSNESDLTRRLAAWLRDVRLRRDAGDSARALVRSGVGAAERSFRLVERLLS